MPRPLRIQYQNAWYHVMNRGISKRKIFLSNTHREVFLNLLTDISKKMSIEIHGYCLMDNHYHLLIRTPYSNLSEAMQYIDGVYTQRFNYCTQRDGALFRGRYKAILIEADAYLMQVSRYIHLNPLETGNQSNLLNRVWSSYPAYLGISEIPKWLKTEFILDMFSSDNPRKSYQQFVKQGVDAELEKFYALKARPVILGHKAFKRQIQKRLGDRCEFETKPDYSRTFRYKNIGEVIRCIAQFYQKSVFTILRPRRGSRNIIRSFTIFMCREDFHFSYKKIAEAMGKVSVNSLSSLVVRIKKKLVDDEKLRKEYQVLLKNVLYQLEIDIEEIKKT